MREIKFRGYNRKNKQWLYGFYLQNRGAHFVAPDEFVTGKEWDDYEVNPETVGQFTGLTDKNGREIYEGDILTLVYPEYTVMVKVEWREKSCCFRVTRVDLEEKSFPLDIWESQHGEVIGNIYEHPELLEQREQARPVIRGKAIYATKGAAREYGRIGCNFYTGCPHNCTYCYLKRGAPSKQLGSNVVQLKKCFKDEADAARILCKELDKHLEQCQRYGIFLSFTTDPLIPNTRELTGIAITEALACDIPVWILTKDASFIYDEDFMEYIDIINPYNRDSIHFGFTLTGRDDMEPHASTNHDRIIAMRWMNIKGFSTFASIEPVIDWQSAERIVRNAMPWCDHFKLGLRSGVKKDYYDLGESGAAIERIVKMCEANGKTVYLKESTRLLLQQYFQPGAYEAFLRHTVDQDGNPIERFKSDNYK